MAAGSAEAAELAAMLALLVAACVLVARLARLGWVADYLSIPVLIGYIHGVAVVLVITRPRTSSRAACGASPRVHLDHAVVA